MSTANRRLVVVALVLGALLLIPLLGMSMVGFGHMGGAWGGHWGGPWGGGGGGMGWVALVAMGVQLLLVGGLLVGGYLLVRAVLQSDDGTDPALEELRLAYARGDIDDDEYQRRRERLDGEE